MIASKVVPPLSKKNKSYYKLRCICYNGDIITQDFSIENSSQSKEIFDKLISSGKIDYGAVWLIDENGFPIYPVRKYINKSLIGGSDDGR